MAEQPPALQLLDDRGELAAADDAERSLEHFVAHKSGLAADAANFAVVSIMGPQSSGKSTLMNQLFGTPFAVMDSAQGRSQTTKGAWLSTSANNTLVLDLQGTDSIESGDGGKTFERQSSLLALALCDVVIVNVWSNDLGRADASNMSLLRTVFEVHLQLFGGAAVHGQLLLHAAVAHRAAQIEAECARAKGAGLPARQRGLLRLGRLVQLVLILHLLLLLRRGAGSRAAAGAPAAPAVLPAALASFRKSARCCARSCSKEPPPSLAPSSSTSLRWCSAASGCWSGGALEEPPTAQAQPFLRPILQYPRGGWR